MAQRQIPSPTSFNSSRLVRLLVSLDIAPVSHSEQTFAEKLSHWVSWTDAISLSRVLANGRGVPAPDARPGGPVGAQAVIELVRRVRTELAASIANDATLQGDTLLRDPIGAGSTVGDKVDYRAYRRNYRAHQHTMEDRIAELRNQVRAAVSSQGPALGELAALDAVFDDAMAAHQRRVLENAPLLLEKRFQSHEKLLQEAPARRADPDRQAPRALPAAIGRTMQHALLAELEVRLQPVEGMVEALGMNSIGQT